MIVLSFAHFCLACSGYSPRTTALRPVGGPRTVPCGRVQDGAPSCAWPVVFVPLSNHQRLKSTANGDETLRGGLKKLMNMSGTNTIGHARDKAPSCTRPHGTVHGTPTGHADRYECQILRSSTAKMSMDGSEITPSPLPMGRAIPSYYNARLSSSASAPRRVKQRGETSPLLPPPAAAPLPPAAALTPWCPSGTRGCPSPTPRWQRASCACPRCCCLPYTASPSNPSGSTAPPAARRSGSPVSKKRTRPARERAGVNWWDTADGTVWCGGERCSVVRDGLEWCGTA